MVIAEGVLVCVAIDRLRPCTSAEAFAYQYLSNHNDGDVNRRAPPGDQPQSFVDERCDIPGFPDTGDDEQPRDVREEQGEASIDDLQPVPGGIDEGDEGVDVPPAMQRDSAAAAAAPASDRAPLQRSLLDDVPRGMRDRGEVMRRRLGRAGSA